MGWIILIVVLGYVAWWLELLGNPKKWSTAQVGGFWCVIVALLVVWLASGSDEVKQPATQPVARQAQSAPAPALYQAAQNTSDPRSMPIEYQLAFLSTGKQISVNDPSVAKARQLLEKASVLYKQPQKDIANFAVKANGMLEKDGVKEAPLEVLEATVLVNDGSLPMQGEYEKLVVFYVMAREKGMTRAEAIVGLRDMFRGIANTNPNR